jgi:small-conductance mechanosensitive channel
MNPVEVMLSLMNSQAFVAFAAVFGASLMGVANLMFLTRVVAPIASRTTTDFDDQVLSAVRAPMVLTWVLAGTWYAVITLRPPDPAPYVLTGLLMTVGVVTWTLAGFRTSKALLGMLTTHQHRMDVIQPRTLPVFDFALKTVVVGAAAYFLLLAWDIDPAAWLASAGIVGIAVGFGARDTLANLFAGVFIVADAPYQLGDVLILETGERGRVTEIGIRSTRLLTKDEVEVIIPNAEMANARIVNASGGPYIKYRLRVGVGVGYGTDIDQLETILLEIASQASDLVLNDPRRRPVVHFAAMGESSLDFELRVWLADPARHDVVLSALNRAIYKRLNAEGIEIPYPKRDVYVHASTDGAGQD